MKTKFLIVLTAIFIGNLHLSLLDPSNVFIYRPIIAMTIAGFFLLLSRYEMGGFPGKRLLVMYLWLGFSIMSLISAILNEDDLLPEVWQLIGIQLVIFTAFPQVTKSQGIKIVLWAVLLGLSPYLLVSVALYPLIYPFKGIMYNPNSLGIIAVTVGAVLLAFLRVEIAKTNKSFLNGVSLILLLLLLLSSLGIVIASNSRTSFFTYCLLYVIFFVSLFFDTVRNRKWIFLFTVVSVLSVLAGSIAVDNVITDAEGLVASFVGKFVEKTNEQDFLSGRKEIWQMIGSGIEVFGIGNQGMEQYGDQPHNTYVWYLGAKGPIALAFYLATQITVFILAVKLLFKEIRKNAYVLGPLLLIVNYITLGLTETVVSALGDGIQMAFMLMMGLVLFDKTECEENISEPL